MNTQDLIKKLAQEKNDLRPLSEPSRWLYHLVIFSLFYYLLAQFFLGVRADFWQKISEPFFAAEILLMSLLLLSLLVSMTLMIYPDNYQKGHFFKAPKIFLALITAILAAEFFLQNKSDPIVYRMDNLKCSICIAAISIAPAFYFFYILKNGISNNQKKSGFYAAFTAAIIGCIALRISEAQDLILHVVIWHYLPIIFFSALGSLLGKMILKHI